MLPSTSMLLRLLRALVIALTLTTGLTSPLTSAHLLRACGTEDGDIPCSCDAIGEGWYCCGTCSVSGNDEWIIVSCAGCCPPRVIAH